MTPREIVAALDDHIVAQGAAKRAMAVALRSRWRRARVESAELRGEILPKNILMVGPTGCGKTEIARRLAKMVDAPFVKVEATKFTEVGFHGRDVDQIIRDLLENAVGLVRARVRRGVREEVRVAVEERILDDLTGCSENDRTRDSFRALLRNGELEEREIEVEEPTRSRPNVVPIVATENDSERFNEILSKMSKALSVHKTGAGSASRRKLTVREARTVLEDAEAEKHMNEDEIVAMAIEATEQSGIVFIDEIDKICTPSSQRHGADASSEGVQRDLLPIIEGSTVSTKRGNVNTDHILFVASGAFHQCKPSDLMAELQGRLPIRVELAALSEADLLKILTTPKHSLLKQHQHLLATEGVTLVVTDAACAEIARTAAEINLAVENIGARRLHTVLERLLEEVSFEAPEMKGQTVTIDATDVQGSVGQLVKKADLSKFVL